MRFKLCETLCRKGVIVNFYFESRSLATGELILVVKLARQIVIFVAHCYFALFKTRYVAAETFALLGFCALVKS